MNSLRDVLFGFGSGQGFLLLLEYLLGPAAGLAEHTTRWHILTVHARNSRSLFALACLAEIPLE